MAKAQIVIGANGESSIDNLEILLGSYTYGSGSYFTVKKEDGTIIGSNGILQGDLLRFEDRSSGGFKYTLSALASCYVKGTIKLDGTVIGSFDGNYPVGDIQVYNSSTKSGTLTVDVTAQ